MSGCEATMTHLHTGDDACQKLRSSPTATPFHHGACPFPSQCHVARPYWPRLGSPAGGWPTSALGRCTPSGGRRPLGASQAPPSLHAAATSPSRPEPWAPLRAKALGLSAGLGFGCSINQVNFFTLKLILFV